MNKKIAIVFVIAVCILQFVLVSYFNFRYATYDIHVRDGKNYVWFLIVRLGLNEVVVFSIGFLIYFIDRISRIKSVMISSIVLLLSILLLLISGVYYGISSDDFFSLSSNVWEMYNTYLNVFYSLYGIAFFVFFVSVFRSNSFEYLPKLLLVLMFSLIVATFGYSSLYYGWLVRLLPNSYYAGPARYAVSIIIMYPVQLSMYIASALYIFKSSKNDTELVRETNTD